jgi:hypothetical protein
MRRFIVSCVLLALYVAPTWAQQSILLKPNTGSCGNYRGGLRLVASASPDMGGIAPATLVPVGTTVKLYGISERIRLDGTCTVTSRLPVPFQWKLFYLDHGGQETNVSGELENANSLTPRFRPNNPGMYLANLTAADQTYSVRVEVIRRGHGWVPLGPMGLVPPGSDASASVGRVNDLAFDPRDPSVVYASTAWGGVFRSNDSGLNWIPVTDLKGLPYLSTGAIAVSATGTVFVGLGDSHAGTKQFYPDGDRGALWRSEDGGTTWHASQANSCAAPATDQVDSKVTRIFVGSRFPEQVLVATFNGILRSIDGGNCWQRVPGLTTGKFTDLNFDPRTDDTLWIARAGTPPLSGVALVTGVWSASPTVGTFFAPSTDEVTWAVIARAPSNPATAYCAIAFISGNHERADILRSRADSNGATSWTRVKSSECTKQCSYDLAIAVHPLDENHVLFADVKPHHSTNRGNDFGGLTNNGSAHDDFHVLVFPPSTFDQVFAGTDGGVFRLAFQDADFQHPSSEWEPRNAYLNIAQAGTLSNSSFHRETVAIGTWDNGSQERTADRTWSIVRRGDGYFVSYDATPDDRLYLNDNAGFGSDTMREPDGKSFGSPSGFEANPYVAGELWGQRLDGKPDTGAYVWTDASNGWLCADPAPSPTRFVTNVDFTPDGHYFTGADDGSIHRFTLVGMSKATKCGATTPLLAPELIFKDLPGAGTRISVSVDPFDLGSTYAVLTTPSLSPSSRVIRVSNDGVGWGATELADNLRKGIELSAAIAADPLLKGVVYVGSQHGLWAGTPDAAGHYSWTKEEDIPETAVTFIQAQRGAGVYTGVLRLATFGRGIWERKLSSPCTPEVCAGVVRVLPCVACLRIKTTLASAIASSTELVLQVPIPVEMRSAGQEARFMRITPSIDGKPLPSFLSRAGTVADSDLESTIIELAYVPPADGLDVIRTDGLILEQVDSHGRPTGPKEFLPFHHSWRRAGASVLRVTAFDNGPIKQPLAAQVKIGESINRLTSFTTPFEVAVPRTGPLEIQWSNEPSAWQDGKTECFLNGTPYPYSGTMRLKVASDAVLSCGVSHAEAEAEFPHDRHAGPN